MQPPAGTLLGFRVSARNQGSAKSAGDTPFTNASRPVEKVSVRYPIFESVLQETPDGLVTYYALESIRFIPFISLESMDILRSERPEHHPRQFLRRTGGVENLDPIRLKPQKLLETLLDAPHEICPDLLDPV